MCMLTPTQPNWSKPRSISRQRGVDMRQRQHDVGGDALRIAMRQIGISVVQHADRFDAFRLVGR